MKRDVGGDQAAGGGVEVAVAARRRGAATRNQASPHRGVVRARCFRTGRRRNRPRDGFVYTAPNAARITPSPPLGPRSDVLARYTAKSSQSNAPGAHKCFGVT